VAEIVCRELGSEAPVVIASIISLKGSSPRHNGTKMAVGEDGRCYGTIGGSLLEATSIKEAQNVLKEKHSSLMPFDLMGNGADSQGMICGGKATVLLDYIAPTFENKEFFKNWRQVVSSGQDSYLLISIKYRLEGIEILGRTILFKDGRALGSQVLCTSDLDYICSEFQNISITNVLDIKEIQVIVDPIRKIKTLYIFGAGHVAVPVAKIAVMTGFRLVVIDDRVEFANNERFPDAYEIKVVNNFEAAFEGLNIDPDSFIVIVTRGHMYDRIVLQQSLKLNAGYIGMISSRKKRDSIYEALLQDGITKEALEMVHSPIGIKIGGETPEEIAVSIVAELINERWKQQEAK
jgi:xanthine dehydrogenase accessory factor